MRNNQKIPAGWSVKKLGDIGKISMCKRIMKHETNPLQGIPFYKIGTFGGKPDSYISEELYHEYRNKYPYPKKGDILISAAGTIGRTVIFDGKDAYFQDSNIVWIANDETKALNRYLVYYYTTSPWYATTGGAIPRLYNENIANAKLLLPPLPEQEKIAEILGTWDVAIEKLSRLIEQKKLLKKGLMQKLLTGKTRLPGFSQPWKEVKLGEIADLYQPQTISQEMLIDSGYPVYGANGFIGYFSECNHKTWQIMVTCRGSTCGTVNRTKGPSWITGNAMVINCDKYDIYKIFLYYKLLMERFFSVISGSGQPQIVRSPLLKWKIYIPSDISEQQAIADVLSAADDEINLLNQKLEAMKEQKKGLMQQLLTGQIRVKVN